MKILRNLRGVILTAALCGALAVSAAAPKYIFYFIGDGMGMGPVMAAENYVRMCVPGQERLTMTSLPVGGSAMTYSASSPVTDSAAAGTALSTGSKTKNGMLGMNADTVNVYSIAKSLAGAGYGIGIITDCAADDATPGAFYAHQPKRSMYYEIARDAAASGFGFIAGASMRGKKDKDGRPVTDLWQIIEDGGFTILRGQEGARKVASAKSDHIMLLNPDGYGNSGELGYVVDGVGSDGVGLTLPMVMDACMTQMERTSPDRFFMMVEAGLIDHALHGNDGNAAVRQVLGLDECVARAMEFYRKHPDETLIVITADHDTGGMTVGCKATGYMAYPKYVTAQKISKDAFSDYCKSLIAEGKTVTWEEMESFLQEKLGLWTVVPLTKKQTKEIREAFRDTFVKGKKHDEKGLYSVANGFAAEVFKVYNNAIGWGFTTPNHTGNPVPVFAIGDGAEVFGRMQNNTEIAPAILRLTGVSR